MNRSLPVFSLAAFSLLTAFGLPAPATAQTTEGLGAPKTGETVEATQLSKLPKQKKFVEAEYPKEAADKGIEAEVGLLIDIDAAGQVSGVVVTEPATPPGMGFDEAATTAAQQFEFEPAELEGKPIAIQLNYRTRFKLAAKPAPAPVAAAPAPKVPVENFTGTLLERGTRLPLAGVMVTVFRDRDGENGQPGKAEGFEATTDAAGKFHFFDLAPAEWKLVVEAPGFYPFRTTETVSANEAITATYYVERGSYNPYDVTVTATRPRKEVSRTVIDVKVADKVPGTAGDPLAVVQNFAGVARAPATGLLIVRGSAPEDTKIYADGAEIPLIYHFGGLRSVIPVGMLDAIEFYPGNFSTMYGRATGGIVDVQIKKLQPPKLGGYADVSLLDTGVFLEAPINKNAAVAIAGRCSYIGQVIKVFVPDDANVSTLSAPRYCDYQVLGNYRPAAAHDLRLFFFGSDDKLELLFKNPADLEPTLGSSGFSTGTQFYRSILTYKYTPSEKFQNDLRLSQGRNRFQIRGGPLILDVDTYTVQLRDTVRHKFSESFTLAYGFDGFFQKFDALVQLPLPPKEGEPPRNFDLSQVRRSENNDVNQFYPAGYAEVEWRPGGGLFLLPGLRVDRFFSTEQWVFQPRLTARWDVSESLLLKGGAGLFTQEPNVQEGEDDEVFGNPDLLAERAWHYSLGVEWKVRPHITLDATGFYKDLRSLVSKTDAVVVEGDRARPLIYDNGGRGRVYGLELVARHEFTSKFTGWLAYTLSKAERRDSGSDIYRLFDFDQTHILTAVASYLLPRNWQVGGRFRLVSGNPRTPIVGGIFNSSSDRYDPVFGKVNSDRNPMFHQLDLRVDKRWVYDKWMFSLYMDIQNVYNRSNTEQLTYNYNYTESKPAQGLPILTILGMRAEF